MKHPRARCALVCALALGIGSAADAAQQPSAADSFSSYGDPVETDVRHLSRRPREFHQRAVRVRGHLGQTQDGRLSLKDDNASVMLLPVDGLSESDIRSLMAVPVEIVGAAREIPESQLPCDYLGQMVPESKCVDPLLPVLPNRGQRMDSPRVAVSFWAVSDATPLEALSLWKSPASSVLENLAAAPESFAEQTVTVVGQFRGANLFGDLPLDSHQEDTDWVVSEGSAAVWVTGKKPKGKGWRLDLQSKSDSKWWLEVVGKVEARGAVAYIHAKSVRLRPAPATQRE